MSSVPKVMVVGGNGFLGRYLIEEITRRGWSCNNIGSRQIAPKSYLGDIRAGNFTAVLSAAVHKYQFPEEEHFPDYRYSNIELPRLLSAACAVSRTAMVLVGTRWSLGEYGEGPNSLYAATKLLGENAAMSEGAIHGYGVTVIRVRDLVGPRDPRDNVFRQLQSSAKVGSALSMTSGHQLIDPIDVRDTGNAILDYVVEHAQMHQCAQFEIGLRPQSIRQIASLWQQVTGFNVQLNWGQLASRGTELYRMDHVHDMLPTFRPRSRIETLRDMSFT